MRSFLRKIQFVFRPSFWIMNQPFCPFHDAKINDLMDNNKFTEYSSCTAYLGNTKIWISNYPYAVGIDAVSNITRPSRLTILKMRKKLNADILDLYD